MWDTCVRVLFSAIGEDEGAGEGEILGVVGFLQVRCNRWLAIPTLRDSYVPGGTARAPQGSDSQMDGS